MTAQSAKYLARRETIARAYIDGPFGQIHYRSESERVPLLVLHQALLSQRQLRPDFAYALEGGGVDIVDEATETWLEAVATFVLAR
ncbi:MAG: hypothetical protein AAF221_02920 [Pseudomonadota bacterium]